MSPHLHASNALCLGYIPVSHRHPSFMLEVSSVGNNHNSEMRRDLNNMYQQRYTFAYFSISSLHSPFMLDTSNNHRCARRQHQQQQQWQKPQLVAEGMVHSRRRSSSTAKARCAKSSSSRSHTRLQKQQFLSKQEKQQRQEEQVRC